MRHNDDEGATGNKTAHAPALRATAHRVDRGWDDAPPPQLPQATAHCGDPGADRDDEKKAQETLTMMSLGPWLSFFIL